MRDYKVDFKDGFENLPREEYPELYNTYSTYLYTERATTILEDYAVGNNAKPFFMYLATQSIHDPLEVPIEYEEMYPDSNIDSQLRKVKSKLSLTEDRNFFTCHLYERLPIYSKVLSFQLIIDAWNDNCFR